MRTSTYRRLSGTSHRNDKALNLFLRTHSVIDPSPLPLFTHTYSHTLTFIYLFPEVLKSHVADDTQWCIWELRHVAAEGFSASKQTPRAQLEAGWLAGNGRLTGCAELI